MNTDSTMVMINEEVSGVIILHINGKLNVGGNVRLFREQVRDLLAAGSNKILVDLAGVTHMDSAGIGELLMARETVSIVGGEIKLLNLGKRAQDIPHVVILFSVFETFEEKSSALFSYSSSKSRNELMVEPADTNSEFRWVDGWLRLIDLRKPAPREPR